MILPIQFLFKKWKIYIRFRLWSKSDLNSSFKKLEFTNAIYVPPIFRSGFLFHVAFVLCSYTCQVIDGRSDTLTTSSLSFSIAITPYVIPFCRLDRGNTIASARKPDKTNKNIMQISENVRRLRQKNICRALVFILVVYIYR